MRLGVPVRLPPALPRVLREARRWGLPGALGAVLMAAALALLLGLLPRERRALHDDERALHRARVHAAARLAPERGAAPADPQTQFLAAFAAPAQRHRRVTNLLSLAAGMGLQPSRSELRSLDEADLPLARVRVVLPLTGSYLQLRRYIEQALRDDPALSLDLLRLERADAQADALRAELQWSLWMRAADAAAARSAP